MRKHPKDHIRIQQTIKHKFGQGSFGNDPGFILPDHAQGEFTQQIHIFLNGFVGNAQIIFLKVNIQQPVHGFHGPFHPGMMKQILRRKRAAGNIIMPLRTFSRFCLKFCMNRSYAGQAIPLRLLWQPLNILRDKSRPLFDSVAAFFPVCFAQTSPLAERHPEHNPGYPA